MRGLGAQVRVRRAFSRAGCDFGCWRWWSRDPQRLPWVLGRPVGVLGAVGPPLCCRPLAVRPLGVTGRPTRGGDSFWTSQGSSRWRPAAPRNSRFCAAAAASSRRRPTWSPSVRPPTPRAAPARRRLAADVVYCWARGRAMPGSSPLWQLSRARVGSLPAVVDRPRVRAARPRAGEAESASAGPAKGGCPPTRSRAARARCLRRGTPPCSSTPPRRCSAPRVEPSVGSGPSLPPVRRVSRPPVIAYPLLFVGCCRPVAHDLHPAHPAPCAPLASFPGGSDGKESACNA